MTQETSETLSGGIDTNADVIDSRDVMRKINELRDAIRDLILANQVETQEYRAKLAYLESLEEFLAEVREIRPDYYMGLDLVRASHWTRYAETFLGKMLPELPPFVSIDWEKTARDWRVEHNLGAAGFAGVTYYIN